MAAFNFPNSPSVNDLHTENGVTFKWNGTIWLRVGNSYSDISTLNVSGISTFNDVVNIETDDNNALNIIDTTASFRPSINFKKNDSGTVSTLMQIRVEGTNGLDIKDGSGNRRLRITSAGRVGIGTDDPNSLVNVYSGRTSPGTSTVYPFTSAQSGTYSYTPYLHELTIHNDIRGTEGSFAGIFFRAGSDSDGQKIGAARISAVETGDYKADLVFGTRNTTFAERLRIRYDGNIGIGTDNPQRKLEVWDASESNIRIEGGADYFELRVKDSDNAFGIHKNIAGGGSSEVLRITSTGRVRIGTGAIGLTNSMTAQGGLQVSTNGASGAPTVCFGADGTAANTQSITDNTIKDFRMGFPNYDIQEEPLAAMCGFVGDGSDTDSSGSARLYIGGGTSWMNAVNHIRFYTASNLTTVTGTERLRITSSGIIGVNNANPNLGGGGDGIHIASSGAAELHLTGSQGSASTDGLQIQMSGTSANIINRESGIIRFYTGGAASGNERLRITSTGIVGINQSSPDSNSMLDVMSDKTGTTVNSNRVALFRTNGGGRDAHITLSNSSNTPVHIGQLSSNLYFTTNNAERLRIDNSGYVGIKRSTPLANLHVTNNELAIGANPTSAAAPNATYDGLVVDGEAGSFINIRSRGDGNSAYGRLAFSDDVRSRGYLQYTHDAGDGDDVMLIATAGSERLRIDSSGSVEIKPYTSQTTAVVNLADNLTGGVRVSVNDETISSAINAPRNGCIMCLTVFSTYQTYPQPTASGFVYLDVGSSKRIDVLDLGSAVGTAIVGKTTYTSTVGDCDNGKLTVMAGQSAGTFHLVNRVSDWNATWTITFL